MSKKRKHRHHHGNGKKGNKQQQQQQQQNKAACRRYIIPLAEWQRFERFKEYLPQIEDALADVQENWNSHLNFLIDELQESASDHEEIHDNIRRLCDLIHGVEPRSRKSRRQTYFEKKYETPINEYVGYRPKQKYDNMMAEIIIEDISDGKL